MTNASALRSLAELLETDEAVPYKMIREADPDGLVVQLLRASADELDANAVEASAYRSGMDINAPGKKLGVHTPADPSASEEVTTSD